MVSANFTVESEQLGDGRIPNVAELFFDWVVGPFGGDNLANTEDAVSQTFVWERNGQSGCSYVDDSSLKRFWYERGRSQLLVLERCKRRLSVGCKVPAKVDPNAV